MSSQAATDAPVVDFVRMRSARRTRLRDAMAANGFDAVVLIGPSNQEYAGVRQPPADVRSVVAHELGHAANNDVLVASTIGAAGTAAAVAALALILSSQRRRRRGLRGASDPVVAATVLALATALTVVGTPVESLVSRQVEARADEHALNLTRDPQAMIDLQEVLAVRNLSDLDPGWFAYAMFATHPTPGQRIEMARKWAQAHGEETKL